ncbi:2-keto-4-pentenoate hydratase [Microlunatus sp. Y2014]|uniref:2-keto-4-pentenoate hydratase n=1 Tax=Microlunatus sp. Y2014 TaxID=3418488 RepID=UPI003DA77AEE
MDNRLNVPAILAEARASGHGLPGFPGDTPADLTSSYAIQDQVITSWPGTVVGWKIGYVAPENRGDDGDERLVGPIWAEQLEVIDGDGRQPTMAIFGQGFAAAEAEVTVRLDADPPSRESWTVDDVAELAGTAFLAIEVASSPIADINALGPRVVAADFGNNNGLVVGPELGDWRSAELSSIGIETMIDGRSVGTGSTANLPGGITTAVAQALTILARRGRTLRAGELLATGAITGIHDVVSGQRVEVTAAGVGGVSCRVRG